MSAETRLRARETQRSCLVQAPAGAGKTELLTQRILALLAMVDEPEEILALTFTRKAAAEMRKRVMDALLGSEPDNHAPSHQMETWQLAQRAMQRSDERGWHLDRHPARLHMMTLDSLTHALARQLPLLSGLGAMPSPCDHADALYREAAEAALNEAVQQFPDEAECVLLHQDHNALAVIRLLAEMLGKREQWLEEVAAHARDMSGLRQMLEANLAAVMNEQLADCDARIPPAIKEKLLPLIAFAAEQREDHCIDPLTNWPQVCLSMLPQWRMIADFLLTANDPAFRKRVDKNTGFPAGKTFAAQKADMLELLSELAMIPGLADVLHSLRQLPDTSVMDDGQWRVLASLFVLLVLAHKHLQLVFAGRGEADFTEIALRAMQALGDEQQPGELLMKMDYRIRHILVDEFQDTSLLQLRLLQKLTAGWQEGDAMQRSLFMVGDPMQSIYRFRKAEVGLFLNAANNAAGLPHVETLQLERNFRSAPVIVDWVNRAFKAIFPDRQDAVSGAVVHVPAAAALAHDGKVMLCLQSGKDVELEAAAVVGLVRQELAEAAADGGRQRIGILARSRKHLHAIMPALSAAGIPFRAINILPLDGRPEVRLLRALLRALLHPADRESWAAVLRAPCCGLPSSDLYQLMADDERPVWELLGDSKRTKRMSTDGQVRAAFVYQALMPCMLHSGRVAVRDLLVSAWSRLAMPQLLDADSAQNISTALALITDMDEGGRVDFSLLDERLQALYAAPDASDEATRVELLTMHGAKGLQWDVVILPGLGHGGNRSDSPLLAFSEVPASGGGIPLMAVRAATRQQDALYSLVRNVEKSKYNHELERLLYVACTRAECSLYMLGHVSEKGNAGKGSLLYPLLAHGEDCFGAEIQSVEAIAQYPEDTDERQRMPEYTPLQRVASVPDLAELQTTEQGEDEAEYVWAGAEAAPVGNALHAALQHVAEKGIEQWSAPDTRNESVHMQRMLMADGLSGDLLEAAVRRCVDGLKRVLGSRKGQWLLSGRHSEAHCEWPLSEVQRGQMNHKVIDRSFIDEHDIRWIIDYKTATHEGGDMEKFLANEEQRHRQQLAKYVHMLRRMDSKHDIKAALYFPLLDAWREVDL